MSKYIPRFSGNEFDFVNKHMNTFNKSSVEEDKKKKDKRLTKRKMKHKGKDYE